MGFREYFLGQADLADDLYERGFHINCHIGATAAIDALAAIWLSDFETEAQVLAREFGGTVPAAARMARFVRRFASDARADLIAVVRFCEDARAPSTGPELTEIEALLADRRPHFAGEFPPAHKDLTLVQLAAAAPSLFSNAKVRAIAEEYHYPALLYTLYRCPAVHSFSSPKQAQGFAVDEEVFYMPLHAGFTSIGFGHKLVTNWLRASVNGFVDHCSKEGVEPGKRINPGEEQEARLEGKWKKAFSKVS